MHEISREERKKVVQLIDTVIDSLIYIENMVVDDNFTEVLESSNFSIESLSEFIEGLAEWRTRQYENFVINNFDVGDKIIVNKEKCVIISFATGGHGVMNLESCNVIHKHEHGAVEDLIISLLKKGAEIQVMPEKKS